MEWQGQYDHSAVSPTLISGRDRSFGSGRELSGVGPQDFIASQSFTDPRGAEIGLLELDFRTLPECELSFFGLVPTLTGQGFGRWLMANALSLAWRKGVERLRVHTCTLDSPAALGFYIRSGFTPFAREVETFADPRIAGILPRDAAPHVPLLDQSADA